MSKVQDLRFLLIGLTILILSFFVSFLGSAEVIMPIVLGLYAIIFFGFMVSERRRKRKGISDDET